MNSLFIQLPPQHLFTFFYSLAFLVALSLLIYEGYKRNFPILPWVLIITFSEILFIIGTKLFALTHNEWEMMYKNLVLVPTTKKVLFGGLLLMSIGLVAGKYWMNFKPNFLDAFAVALPLSFAIQKLGCFFAGCCYGKLCDLPWAVQYPPYTLPHFHHYQLSLTGPGEFFSLPVHPVQLYEFLGALMVITLVISLRRKWRTKGASFLFSISLYLVIRFVSEFFRDTMAHTNGGAMLGFLNQMQWGILVLFPVFVFLLVFREGRRVVPVPVSSSTIPGLPSLFGFFSSSALLIWAFAGWFQLMELLVVLAAFTLSCVLMVLHISKKSGLVRYRLLYACLMAIPFILMSQTFPEAVRDSVQVQKSKSIGIAFGSGDYDNLNNLHYGEGCDMVSNTTYFNQKYRLAGAALNFRNENLANKQETNFGVNVYSGKLTETNLTNHNEKENKILDINPYLKYDDRWLGIGGGFHAGNLIYSFENKRKEGQGIPTTGNETTHIYPQFYLRAGPRDWLFADYHFADHFPSALPGFRNQIGIGTGFGMENGTSLRAGSTIVGAYLSAYVPLNNGLILEPLVHWSKLEGYSRNYQFSVGLRYEFDRRIQNIPRKQGK